MTSELESIKTNEFLRRRKLRLQQVREQSKDIAKKVRQRANIEKLEQTVNLDAKKQKEYFERQEKLIKKLEVLYARGLENVGASHRSASEVKQQDNITKIDLSKLRAKEAAAELKRKKQEKLDEQKRLLDRKLQAREAANEISREKSGITNKLLTKSSASKDDPNSKAVSATDVIKDKDEQTEQAKGELAKKTDMATQWDSEVQHEWEPAVPTLSLLNDDRDSIKESESNNIDSKSDKNKRLDLFALSKEMPSSLRGGNINIRDERIPVKPSLTLVSEYLQSRGLRLREPEITTSSKKHSDELLSLKQTIQHTRASKHEGSKFNVCHVLDEQVIPVPIWQAAETSCQKCSQKIAKPRHVVECRQLKSVANSVINKIFSSIRPVQRDLVPSPVLRGSSPFRRNKVCHKAFSGKNNVDKLRSNSQDSTLNKKNSVTMYNHSTRNVQDIPWCDERLVTKDVHVEEDAYSQAMKEMSAEDFRDKEMHQKKIQDMRNKVAMTKQSVEKEYKDTMNFLNSLPKEKCNKTDKKAYMDDKRQQILKDNRQRILQQEYKKIEKECRKHHCNKTLSKSKSPLKANVNTDFEKRDFQYAWMPVPESDGSFAIHTIPTNPTTGKHGKNNAVKFSKVDSYHEYRSRHKHTPPTKDTCREKSPHKKDDAVFIGENSSDTTDSSSTSSDSVENLSLKTKDKRRKNGKDESMSDAERIIIYKILDSRSDLKSKKRTKLMSDISKSLSSIEKGKKSDYEGENIEITKAQKNKNQRNTIDEVENGVSFDQVKEGVYKMVKEKGNNITSMYFTDDQLEGENVETRVSNDAPCSCKKLRLEPQGNGILNWECADLQPAMDSKICKCTSTSQLKISSTDVPPAGAPAPVTSFKTNDSSKNPLTDAGFIKLVNEAGEEAGKFYIGATGFLKDDAYEMVIQLRKKGAKDEKRDDKELADEQSAGNDAIIRKDNNAKTKSQQVNTSNVNDSNKKIDDEVFEILQDASVSDTQLSFQRNENVPITNVGSKEEKTLTVDIETNGKVNDLSANIAPAKNNLVDKGVSTSFQLSYAIPDHAPRVDLGPRAATSTFTQTTFSSPNHRPILFHMSSSTSTAYMSPPEMVLPTFLRRDYFTQEEESYEPPIQVKITQKQGRCKHHGHYKCKMCSHLMKNELADKRTTEYKNMSTPPNTVRSNTSEYRHGIYIHKHKRDATNPTWDNIKDNCKCKRCLSRIMSNHCVKSDTYYRHTVGNKPTNRNINRYVSVSTTPKNNRKNANIDRSKLNPLIKQYVNKLLELNKEGIRAIEVAEQECSSVTTPGSSIINVPCNVDERKGPLQEKISLEQIKNMLKQQMIKEQIQKMGNKTRESSVYENCPTEILKPNLPRKPRLKTIHKIKSLNISKHLLKPKSSEKVKNKIEKFKPMSTTDDNDNNQQTYVPVKTKCRSKSSPTPRQVRASGSASRFTDSDVSIQRKVTRPSKPYDEIIDGQNKHHVPPVSSKKTGFDRCIESISRHRATMTSTSPDSELNEVSQKYKPEIPVTTSTQTSHNVDSEVSFMKVAEDKLQNMGKIADLTEKCTKRLSDLAKVLEEVRRNKSLAYSQISTSDSTTDSDQKSDKAINILPQPEPNEHSKRRSETNSPALEPITEDTMERPHLKFTPFLTDIPKPAPHIPTNTLLTSTPLENFNLMSNLIVNTELALKSRPKPPPALSRIHLKHGQELIVPHELSTVMEVDSPMSVKHKNYSVRNEATNEAPDNLSRTSSSLVDKVQGKKALEESNGQRSKENNVNPDLLQTNTEFYKQQSRSSSTESSVDSKLQMIDLKQFNEIMLEPFISIHEYAKQYNVETLDEGSNMEDVQREDVINDDISSLHSDGSLPDVIAELLKRNIITEPFKFDTASNINSTTISSESTLSVLALSKIRKNSDKRRSSVMFQNKENIGETSDSLSISSNPDLENAFKKLGMGWASSTLKKTKERLALSSSSNTSSSSVSQFKMKSLNQDIPALVTDSVSSVLNLSKKAIPGRHANETAKNVEQQTSISNSMTVKEFLTNELAKKITFTNKSNRNDTEEEFVSLFETKIPEEIKNTSEIHQDRTMSPSANRARTSTPVQIFKSMTYHSTSSSNVSNGLFSNADDLSSVKMTSNSMKNHSTSDKDDLTVPNFSLRMKKGSDCSKSD